MTDRLTEDEVKKVASLSRLTLTDEELHRYAGQLSSVLEYVSQLSELDVQDVEPMAHATDITNVLREDLPEYGLKTDEALNNAPGKMPPYFEVPKVLGDGGGA